MTKTTPDTTSTDKPSKTNSKKQLSEVGGFIKFVPPSNEQRCLDPEHNPPGMIVLPPGRHTYQCPSCGKITSFTVPLVTL